MLFVLVADGVLPHDISTHDDISLNPSMHHQLPPQPAAQDSWSLAAPVSWPAMQYMDFKVSFLLL